MLGEASTRCEFAWTATVHDGGSPPASYRLLRTGRMYNSRLPARRWWSPTDAIRSGTDWKTIVDNVQPTRSRISGRHQLFQLDSITARRPDAIPRLKGHRVRLQPPLGFSEHAHRISINAVLGSAGMTGITGACATFHNPGEGIDVITSGSSGGHHQ